MGVAEAVGGLHRFPAALTSFIGRDSPVPDVAGPLTENRLASGTRLGADAAPT
jgi:hypothetical protein